MEFQILPDAESRAAETLYREMEDTRAALTAFLVRVQGPDQQARRLSPGVWALVRNPEPRAPE